MNSNRLAAIAAVLSPVLPVRAQELVQDIQPPALPNGSGFAIPELDGTRLAVGAFYEPVNGVRSGTVRVYAPTTSGWEERALLTPPAPEENQLFALPELRGEWLVVGAPGTGLGKGKVFVHRAQGSAFVLHTELELASANETDFFGSPVRLAASTLAVGARGRWGSVPVEGAVLVYELDPTSGAWNLAQELHPPLPETSAGFGNSLDLEGDLMAVGMPWADTGIALEHGGRVVVFERVAGIWTAVQTLTAEGLPGVTSSSFGTGLELDGDRLLVGDPDANGRRGALFVYTRTGSAFGNPRVISLPGSDSWAFGGTLALSGDRLLASSTRFDQVALTHLFARDAVGDWSYQATWETDGGTASSWTLLALHGGLAAIGHPADSPMQPSHPGHVEMLRIPLFAEASCFCGAAAPCGNVDARAGCANSSGSGAVLYATGSASVAQDDLGFRGEGLPAMQTALLFAGAGSIPALPLSDGLRCVAGPLLRLTTGTSNAVGAIDIGPGLGAVGAWSPGDERVLQLWYRDPSGSPCGSGANLTHASRVRFAP